MQNKKNCGRPGQTFFWPPGLPDTKLFFFGLMKTKITKKDTAFRQAIHAGNKLAVTLRFLATGESYSSLACQFRIYELTIGQLMPTVCDTIYSCRQYAIQFTRVSMANT